jgi:hypothetical protein
MHRFGVRSELEAERVEKSVINSNGHVLSLMEWCSAQAVLALKWHQIMAEPLIADSSTHREKYQAVHDAIDLRDILLIQRHLKSHLPDDLHQQVVEFVNAGICRIGKEMRILCKYAGVDVDTAAVKMEHHFAQMRTDVHALLHHWNEKAGDITVPLPQANGLIHERIHGIQVNDHEGLAHLFVDVSFPHVAGENDGPHFDSQHESHRGRIITSTLHPYWINNSRIVTAV